LEFTGSASSIAEPNFSGQRSRVTCTLLYAEYVGGEKNGKCYSYGLAYRHGHICVLKKPLWVIIWAED